MKFPYIIILLSIASILAYPTQGQGSKKETPSTSEQTIFRKAGNYSEVHDVLTIAALRGTAYKAEYDKYMIFLSEKLDSLNIPHKIFQEFDETQGTGFAYFVKNDLNGMFDAQELIALLPHIERRFKKEYPNKFQD